MSDPLWLRSARTLGVSVVVLGALAAAATLYTATGGGARDLLVKELLVNLVLVLGLQVFVGATGILSFGHLAFAQIAAYTVALATIPVATKATQLPDLPLGLGDVALHPLVATLVAVGVTVGPGLLVGLAVARAGGVAATMITLAVLFVVDQVVKNWTELTKGAGGLGGVPLLGDVGWLWIGALVALMAAHGFAESRPGRLAVAVREDEVAAAATGVGLVGARLGAWVLSLGLVALGGALRVQSLGSTNPRQYTLDVTVLLLAMLVLGGMRTVSGAVLGTVLVTAGNEVARQLGDRWEVARLPDLFLGLVLLTVMILRPGGLLGDRDLAAWVRRRTRRPRPVPAVTPPTRTATLEATDVTVHFGGFIALDGAGVRVRPGEVVGLIGPNGAGKTTLFNVLTGLVTPVAGRVCLGERDLTGLPPHRVARAGLARTFQNLRLFANLSVRENVAVAALVAARHRPHEPAVDVDALVAQAGLADLADRPAGTLDYGNQRRLELARAAALAPEFLLIDEPTSGMSDDESLAMVDQVRTVAAAVGAGVLVIDHDLAFITRISDHVVALADGRVIAEGSPDDVRGDPAVATAYLGEGDPAGPPAAAPAPQ